MKRAWEAEQEIEPNVALALIQDQFPDLHAQKIGLLGVGWDNTAYLINDQYVFRFPRRQIAVALLEDEACMLPKLAKRFDLAIPIPKWKGKPTDIFFWPFLGYQMLPGKTACQANLSDEQRLALAEPLGRFLKALHSTPLSIATSCNLRGDTIGKLDTDRIIPLLRKHLEELKLLGLIEDSRQFDRLFEADFPSPKANAIIHGDLYVRHLLVDDRHHLTAVIDWGDIHIGDPASDLGILYSFLPPQAHDRFEKAYGPISDQTKPLIRLRALYHSVLIAIYGHHRGDAAIAREGLWALTKM